MKKLIFIVTASILLPLFGTAPIYAFDPLFGSVSPFGDEDDDDWMSAFDDNIDASSNSYSVFSIGYEEIYFDFEGEVGECLKGVGLQLTNSTSLFLKGLVSLDWGLRAYMGFYGDTDKDYDYDYDGVTVTKIKSRLMSCNMALPLSLGIHIPLGHNKYLTLYSGMHGKFFLLGRGSMSVNGKKEKTFNVFSKKDMGMYDWDRWQYGWHAGGRLELNQFVISFEYGKQLSDICDETPTHHIMLTMGVKI